MLKFLLISLLSEILKNKKFDSKSVKLHKTIYNASEGWEYFLQFKDKNDILVGFLRLRLTDSSIAMIRELHVYGTAIGIGEEGDVQHKGLGRKLMAQAESIAKQRNKKEIIVISGIGVREYYRKLGYTLKNKFMWKKL